jgi:phosphoribosylanthranilate isomerase
MGVRVKMCGITNLADALSAVEAGADALGFVFCESSPRCLTVQAAAKIIAALPPFVAKVGLFVDASEAAIREAVEHGGIDVLQLHGDEPCEFCHRFQSPVIKAFRVRDASSLTGLPHYNVAAWLLDSYVPGKPGGTGERFNWELACHAAQLGRPIILAGGLTPANVADAVRQVRPYAVDVSSGVESAPGKKDSEKVKAFIQAAKSAL